MEAKVSAHLSKGVAIGSTSYLRIHTRFCALSNEQWSFSIINKLLGQKGLEATGSIGKVQYAYFATEWFQLPNESIKWTYDLIGMQGHTMRLDLKAMTIGGQIEEIKLVHFPPGKNSRVLFDLAGVPVRAGVVFGNGSVTGEMWELKKSKNYLNKRAGSRHFCKSHDIY